MFKSSGSKAAPLAKKVRAGMKAQHGFEPQVLLLTPAELQAAIEANPFPLATSDPESIHFFFLDEPSTEPNLESLEKAKSPSEAYQLFDRVFYLHAPDGIGRSKLAANAEKYLDVATTARNYRTVEKLVSMVTT